MAVSLRIADGNPVWASTSIIPSKDKVVSPNASPSVAAVHVTSQDVYVYVKVENNGTVDLGECPCNVPLPATWPVATTFSGFLASTNATQKESQAGVTFQATPGGDSLSGGVSYFFGQSTSGRRAWAWSPDGRYFAYAGSASGNDWSVSIVALQDVTRSDGSTIKKGSEAAKAQGLFAGPPYWTNDNFSWAGIRAVVAAGASQVSGSHPRAVICPEAPGNNTYGDVQANFPGQLDWVYVSSPCGWIVAFVPQVLVPAFGSAMVVPIATATATVTQFRQNNVPVAVQIFGPNPSIVTNQHAALGVHVDTGKGSGQDVDDVDCGKVTGGSVFAWVDRVKASTLPSANLGVMAVGSAAVSLIKAGKSIWVQVPPPKGWANQGEPHWCLLAQAYTEDGKTIPKPWNGQAASPPPFPVQLVNCAQRNIDIA